VTRVDELLTENAALRELEADLQARPEQGVSSEEFFPAGERKPQDATNDCVSVPHAPTQRTMVQRPSSHRAVAMWHVLNG
jgi:hypothetical protein